MCKRNTQDPLVRTFLDRYHLNLLPVPREKSDVGDVYVFDERTKQTSAPGSITYFLEPPLKIPPVMRGEAMADLSGKVSHGVDARVGFGLLGPFLAALGAAGLMDGVQAAIESKRASAIRFRFPEATRDSVDPFRLGAKLYNHKIPKRLGFLGERNRYYLVTAVARTRSISIVAEADGGRRVDVDVNLLGTGTTSAGVAIRKSSEGEITFSGKKKLAFGVELHELAYDKKRAQLGLRMPEGVIAVRGPGAILPIKPSFIGGEEDDIFLKMA